MIPIKIQCGCGQRYSFDVEPVNGHMPSTVTCPVCGMDGTLAANDLIAQTLASQPAAPPPRLSIAKPHPSAAPAYAEAHARPLARPVPDLKVRRQGTRIFTRNRIFGGIGVLWGGAILVTSIANGIVRGHGAYAAGEAGGTVFGGLIFVVGLYYLIKGGSQNK